MALTRLFLVTSVLLAVATGGLIAADGTVRVITDRTESHLKPLFKHFTETTGITVQAVYVDKGLLPRLQAQPTEADLVITKTAENMEQARTDGLLKAFSSDTISSLPAHFIDEDKQYVITSYRARALYLSNKRVQKGAISTYQDLTKPEWKGKIAIRSGYHDYNVSLWCQMAEADGIEAVKTFLTGLKANLARAPKGNDRAQVQAIYEGIADISIGNHYYMGIMLGREDQRPWALATRVFFPNQNGKGCYVMQAAAGLTKADRNVAGATKLLEYLVSDFAQFYMSNGLHVYSVNPKLPLSEVTRKIGEAQGLEEGRFKAHFISLRKINKHRDAVIKILNDLNFDQP